MKTGIRALKKHGPRSVPKLFLNEHDAMKQQLADLRKALLVLQAERLGPCFEEAWKSAHKEFIRVHQYFSVSFSRHQRYEEEYLFSALFPRLQPQQKAVLAAVAGEHVNLQRLVSILLDTIEPWAHASRPPEPAEIMREIPSVLGILAEFETHLKQHEKVEDEVILPLFSKLLSPDELEEIRNRIQADAGTGIAVDKRKAA